MAEAEMKLNKKNKKKHICPVSKHKEKCKVAEFAPTPPPIPLSRNSYASPFLPNHTKKYWVFPNPPTKIHAVTFV